MLNFYFYFYEKVDFFRHIFRRFLFVLKSMFL